MKKDGYFWKTKENIPDGPGYGQFSVKHLVLLFVTVLFTAVLSYFYKISSQETRQIIRITIAISLALLEVLKLIVIHVTDGDLLNYLPLEVCSFAGYCLLLDSLLEGRSYISQMLLLMFLPAATLALLFPTTISLPLCNFFTIHQFLFHGLIVAYTIARYVSGEIPLQYSAIWKSVLTISMIALVIYLINKKLNTNFFFLMYHENNTLLKKFYDLSGDGHLYRLTLVCFSIFMMHVFYLIFRCLELIIHF